MPGVRVTIAPAQFWSPGCLAEAIPVLQTRPRYGVRYLFLFGRAAYHAALPFWTSVVSTL